MVHHPWHTVETGLVVPEQVKSEGPALMEGGIDAEEFLSRNEPFLRTVPGVIEVAMMIETQALDLYLRMAQESRRSEAREVLFQIAEEEKAHLAALGRLLESRSPGALSF